MYFSLEQDLFVLIKEKYLLLSLNKTNWVLWETRTENKITTCLLIIKNLPCIFNGKKYLVFLSRTKLNVFFMEINYYQGKILITFTEQN